MDYEDKRRTFISYPRKNAEFTLQLAKELKAAGLDIWLDQLDIPAGSRWDDEVQKALTSCGVFMVILTPASIASQNVKDEIGYAIDSRKRILPVLLEPCDIPFRMRRFHYVDFTKTDYPNGIKMAIKLLTGLINEVTMPPTPRPVIQPAEMQTETTEKTTPPATKTNTKETSPAKSVEPQPALPVSMPVKPYKNQANSDHPATLLYLVDISGSMNATMRESGKTRIEVAKNAIQVAYAQMIQRSLRQGKIHPRYRVGMIAYSETIYDVYGDLGSIVSVDKLKDQGIPAISPQKSTNMAKAFRYAAKLLREDIQKWSPKWLNECPPPMVINITDCEFDEKDAQDPLEFAKKLQEIAVPDGNVLLENIFITDQIPAPGAAQEWQGYSYEANTGDAYGNKLLAMSSPIPATYAQILREQAGLKIKNGAAMMFPGSTREFIKFGFVMSIVTGSQVTQPTRAR